jgi:hypothetical protein
MTEVVREVLEQGRAYMTRRIPAHSTGPEMLRAYIESNLAFIREHQSDVTAVVEIARNGVTADGQHRFYSYDIDEAIRAPSHLRSGFQEASKFRADFDPRAMAIAIRSGIDAVPGRLRFDPQFDMDGYTREIANAFELATGGPSASTERERRRCGARQRTLIRSTTKTSVSSGPIARPAPRLP